MWLVWLGCVVAWAGHGDGALAEARRLVEEVGPRPTGSPAAERAVTWVSDALTARGWEPERLTGGAPEGTVLACRAGAIPDVLLLLAHPDSVHARGPGANDNAAGVGVLLMVAELATPHRTLCLGFPGGEEAHLLGSRELARRVAEGPSPLPGRLDQVVALDLVGVGTLTHNGLGPAWGARGLRHLLHAIPADVPWVYRAISASRPDLERSDHAWFGLRGVPASQLMARAESGVDWAYHSPADEVGRLEPATLEAAVLGLVALAEAPALPVEASDPWAFVVPWTRWVVGGGPARAMFGAGFLVAFAGLRRAPPRQVGLALGQSVLALVVVFGAMWLAAGGRPLGAALAGPVAVAGWVAVVAWIGLLPRGTKRAGQLAGVWIATVFGGLLLNAGAPLLAWPWAVVALAAARGGPLLLVAAWPAAYLCCPASLRELAFHSMYPAEPHWWAGALVVLGLPALCAAPRGWGRARWRWLVVALLVTWAWSWATPVYSARFFEAEKLAPPRHVLGPSAQ